MEWFEGEYYREVLAHHSMQRLQEWRNRTADYSFVDYLRLVGPCPRIPRPPQEELEEWHRRTARDVINGLEHAMGFSDDDDDAEVPDAAHNDGRGGP